MHLPPIFLRALHSADTLSLTSPLGRILVLMPLAVGVAGLSVVTAPPSASVATRTAVAAAAAQSLSVASPAGLSATLSGGVRDVPALGLPAVAGATKLPTLGIARSVASPPPAPAAKAATSAKSAKLVAPAAPAKAAAKPAPARWLPSGAGAWIYEWSKTDGGNAKAVVAHAKAVGVSALYVRTGDADDGFIGAPLLDQLLPATAGTPISVVAWDFPTLRNPVADAKRLAAAALYTVRGAPRVRAVAPDIETPAEGTYLHQKPLEIYLRTLRKLLPPDVSILGTVPWPSETRANYPYWLVAPYSDALVPMAYWYNRSPASVTAASIDRLRAFHKPVIPAGQGFDPRIDAPYLATWNPGPELAQFLDVAKARGVPAVSLWSWQTLGPSGWHALTLASRMFPKH